MSFAKIVERNARRPLYRTLPRTDDESGLLVLGVTAPSVAGSGPEADVMRQLCGDVCRVIGLRGVSSVANCKIWWRTFEQKRRIKRLADEEGIDDPTIEKVLSFGYAEGCIIKIQASLTHDEG